MQNIIGSSSKLRAVLDEVDLIAGFDCSVLIEGETGTGKDVIAHAIHDASSRRHRPFVPLNCAAIPSSLIESELFGHERGAFTGAVAQSIGRFQAAHTGTLFLDEIGELPLEMQPKLLRVLQQQQFERVGSMRTMQVDVRVVTATNRDLWSMVQEGKFRADLYYRLSVFPITVPALRERKEDIPALVEHFVTIYAGRMGKSINHIPNEVMDALMDYAWPGNIRELQNFIERSVIMTSGPVLSPRMRELNLLIQSPTNLPAQTLEDAERKHILEALEETNWTVGGPIGAAIKLGLPRTTLIHKMHKLGISPKHRSSVFAFNRLVRTRSEEVPLVNEVSAAS